MEILINNNEIIFKPEGEINLYNESLLKEEMINNLDDGIEVVVIDMINVEFVDSSGIGMFIYLNKFFRTKNKSFILRSVPGDVLKILRLGMIDKIIKIE